MMFKMVFLSIVVAGVGGQGEPVKTAMPAASLEECQRVVTEIQQRMVPGSEVTLACDVIQLPPIPAQRSAPADSEIASLIRK